MRASPPPGGRLRRVLLAAVLGGWVAQTALAQPPVPGAETAAFAAARAAWLADDEASGLRGLAELAAGGNTAARLLLGVIDKSPALQGPWLAQLDRAERVALMRAPGGMSGRSWLRYAADHPLGAALLARFHADTGPEVGAALAALGEGRAAREALMALAMREHSSLRSDWHDWMDPELAFVVWPRADAALRARLDAALPPDHPQRALMGGTASPEAWDRWLAEAPAAAALRALCDAECPESTATCRRALMAALGGHAAALMLGSPVEALIPMAAFVASPRGQASVLRRVLLRTDARGRRSQIARTTEADACLGARLSAEDLRYRPARNDPAAAAD